jgi:hypothetical protein
VREAIRAARLEDAIAGKNPAGKAETFGDLFRRVYGDDARDARHSVDPPQWMSEK